MSTRCSGKVFQMPRDCELDMGKGAWGWEVKEVTKDKFLTVYTLGKNHRDGDLEFPCKF